MAPSRDVIVIGASAGGVEALTQLVANLPADLPAAIFIVIHFPAESTSVLPRILSRSGHLPAVHAVGGEKIEPGHIYVAPPDYHLLLTQDHIRLSHGPRENGSRPAIDPLFRSAARAFGPRVIGVILSGTLGDGSNGLQVIKNAGGIAVVQDPREAAFASMPLNAIGRVAVDYIEPATGIAAVLTQISREELVTGGQQMLDQPENENEEVQQEVARFEHGQTPVGQTILTCPECGGVLFELRDGQLASYRCHVGHAYASESLLAEQGEKLEAALWTAVRALEERAMLVRRLGTQAGERGNVRLEDRFFSVAEEAEENADVIRQVLFNGRSSGNFSSTSQENDEG